MSRRITNKTHKASQPLILGNASGRHATQSRRSNKREANESRGHPLGNSGLPRKGRLRSACRLGNSSDNGHKLTTRIRTYIALWLRRRKNAGWKILIKNVRADSLPPLVVTGSFSPQQIAVATQIRLPREERVTEREFWSIFINSWQSITTFVLLSV